MLNNRFMLDSTIGEHSRKCIESLVKVYHLENGNKRKSAFLSHKQEFDYLCNKIGDEYLSKTVSRMYEEMILEYQPKDEIQAKIQWYELKIKELKESQTKND